MCSQECIDEHRKQEECHKLQKLTDRKPSSEIILVLRALLEKNEDKTSIMYTFMDHLDDKKADPEHWDHLMKNVVEPLASCFQGEKRLFNRKLLGKK